MIPTPGVAFLVRRHRADAGIAVSASHNPYPDNGIKLVDRDGFKWSEAAERALEEAVAARLGGGGSPVGEAVPAVAREELPRSRLRLSSPLPRVPPTARFPPAARSVT